jgi:hypothetical protein
MKPETYKCLSLSFLNQKKKKFKKKIKKVTAHQALNGSMYFYTRQQAGFAFM